jgi:hypothetical protein
MGISIDKGRRGDLATFKKCFKIPGQPCRFGIAVVGVAC